MTTPTVDQLKATYQKLAFIHSKLIGSTFYPEDFIAADEALKFITEMANQIATDIERQEKPATESTETHSESQAEQETSNV